MAEISTLRNADGVWRTIDSDKRRLTVLDRTGTPICECTVTREQLDACLDRRVGTMCADGEWPTRKRCTDEGEDILLG